MKPSPRVAVHIHHEDPLMAAGIASVLSREARVEVSEPDAYKAEECTSDVIVSDYASAMQRLKSLGAGATVRTARVVIVTPRIGEPDILAALTAGAAGYLRQGCRANELVDAVLSVARGARYLCRSATNRLAESFAHVALTGRESGVLNLMAAGLCNKDIARTLGISLGTVKAHVSAILLKLGAGSRTQAVARAAKRGLIDHLPAPTLLPQERYNGFEGSASDVHEPA